MEVKVAGGRGIFGKVIVDAYLLQEVETGFAFHHIGKGQFGVEPENLDGFGFVSAELMHQLRSPLDGGLVDNSASQEERSKFAGFFLAEFNVLRIDIPPIIVFLLRFFPEKFLKNH
jgi:hypothetical protein